MKLHKGYLLISEPNMFDPNFKRTVILLTEHNETESIGFILNQPTKIGINDLIDEFPSFNAFVYIGGPVQKDTCLLYTSPSPRDGLLSRMPSSA